MTITTSDEASVDVEVPAELEEKGNELAQRYVAALTQQLEAPAAGAARIGEWPDISGEFDVLATTPIQFISNPPYKPSKIIAGGEWALILAFVIVGGNQGIALAQRRYQVNVERCNLTTCSAGPDQWKIDTFPSPAPPVTVVPFWFRPPVPPAGEAGPRGGERHG